MKSSAGTIFFIKLLISVIITLVILILIKSSSTFKKNFYSKVYDSNLSFTYLKKVYDKYIGDSEVLNKVVKTEAVFNEKLEFKSKEGYFDGVCLNVKDKYLVPANESGIVVFIGEKENYGNTIIIQRIDGIDEWYGNINNASVELYDYIKKGSIIGEANNELYLVYKKDGKVLNYEEYLK